MNRLKGLRDYTQQRDFKVFRRANEVFPLMTFKREHLSLQKRCAKMLEALTREEQPVVFPEEKIAFLRTVQDVPPYFDGADIDAAYAPYPGDVYMLINNICVDYHILLDRGLQSIKEEISQWLADATDAQRDFGESVIICIDSILALAARYAAEAERVGNHTVAELFRRVPRYPARHFHEALQSLRFVSAMFYLTNNYQIGFGRFDQYMFPFYERDIEEHVLTRETAKELLTEFFISLNRDTDLYNGVQQGDNGQSIVLGGMRPDGSDGINDLTYLALEVSCDLKLIDPKINLRVDSQTPDDLLELANHLTRAGLGFPQYENDEVIIPALVSHGYDLADARDYTVAACWEFIIPGKGLDIVNMGAISFPAAVHEALTAVAPEHLSSAGLRHKIRENIDQQVISILDHRNIKYVPSPLVSIFMDGCLEKRSDITVCAKYKNIGLHGAGIANGADALNIIERYLHDDDLPGLKKLTQAVANNFDGEEALCQELRQYPAKAGNDSPESNEAMHFLYDAFADSCERHSTFQRCIRPGTGTAQFYLWLTQSRFPWLIEKTIGAGEDGRRSGEPFSANLSPAQGASVDGILSVLRSFSHIDYTRVMNGGPITVEFDPTSLADEENLRKLTALIRYFVQLGNQQLQLNVLNVETLKDAVRHPELHRNLIVRVWGWSGYFCELEPAFQQQIIHRHTYAI